MDVKVISQKLIKPSNPTPPRLQNLTISFLDQLIPPRTVPMIFFYHPHQQHIHQTLTQLEKSLSQILTLFYPLAGRYIKEDSSINCNDEGVEYSQALVNVPISQILQSNSTEPILNRFVSDEEQESATSPLVSIQINVFECGGLAIGVRVAHRIIDGYTLCMFTNGWAKSCREGNINSVIVPCFNSSALFPPRDVSLSQAQAQAQAQPKPPLKTESKVVMKRFWFDMETISKLKEQSMSNCKAATTTEVLVAFIWRAQINAAKAKQGKQRSALLHVFFGLRGKAFKKIPDNCGGNLIVIVSAKYEEDKRRMGLVDFVEQVRRAIKNARMEYAEAMEDDGDAFFSRVEKAWKNVAEQSRNRDGVVMCYISSLINFPIYEADFGWGKPVWVTMAQRDNPGILLIPRKDGDGVEAWVNMEEEDMRFFKNDPDMVMFMRRGSRNEQAIPGCFCKM